MAFTELTDEQCFEAVRLVKECKTKIEAADRLEISHGTLHHRLRVAARRGITADWEAVPSASQEFPGEDIESIIDSLPEYGEVKKRKASFNQRHIREFNSARHIHIKVPHAPFGQLFIGDPHIDSPGHDDDQFEADLGLIRRAQAEFTCHAIQMGDVLDNWPTGGRLAKKHHDSHITRKEALSLVRGLAQEEGIDWLLWLVGNHDSWPGIDFETLLRQWLTCRVVDWACYIHARTDQGFKFRTFAAHDMPGSSINNPVHALARRAKEEGECDLYVAGHRHKGGQGKDQNGYRDKTYNLMRVRGYKRADEYAWVKGYSEEQEGCTGLAVINPLATTQDGICRTFYDLEEGVDWLRFITARHA